MNIHLHLQLYTLNKPSTRFSLCQPPTGAYNAARISEVMDLQSLSDNHPWMVIETQASTGEGLQEAFKTMARMVKQFHKDSSKAELGNSKSGDATEV